MLCELKIRQRKINLWISVNILFKNQERGNFLTWKVGIEIMDATVCQALCQTCNPYNWHMKCASLTAMDRLGKMVQNIEVTCLMSQSHKEEPGFQPHMQIPQHPLTDIHMGFTVCKGFWDSNTLCLPYWNLVFNL